MASVGPAREGESASSGSTRSDLSGNAGDVVQARDVRGGVHFHNVGPAPGPLPRQLPNDVRGFVNRVVEIDRLDSALDRLDADDDSSKITVVVGTAGVGKTSLAVRWAHRISERFPDGQLYVNLRGYDPGEPVSAADALERFLRALDIAADRIPAGEESRAELFRSLVASRRMLIVLDNAASVAQVRPLLPGSRHCHVVVTSRNRLSGLVARDGARRVSVEVLSSEEAVKLLQKVIADYRSGDEDGDLAELARLCAFLPLALRIAAERAAARPRMPLQELIADLRDESGLWDALSSDDDGEADAVRTVFAWSYRALPSDAAQLFRRLGLHPGPEFSLYAAAALASASISVTRRLLDALIGAHLLEDIGAGRYQFHDLLRAYAADQAQEIDVENDRLESAGRLLRYYLHASAEAVAMTRSGYTLQVPLEAPPPSMSLPTFNDEPAAVAWYKTERANLMLAAKTAAVLGLDQIVWQLPGVLREIHFTVDPVKTWKEAQQAGVEAARRTGDAYGQALMLEFLAIDERHNGHYPEAEDLYSQAGALFDQIENRLGALHIANGLGLLHHQLRDLDGAASHLSTALDIARDVNDPFHTGVVTMNLGEVWLDMGEVERAITVLRDSSTLLSEVGDRTYYLKAHRLLGRSLCSSGRLPEARRVLEEALAGAREDAAPVWEGYTNIEFARLLLAESRFEDALVASQSAATTFRRWENRNAEATAWSLTAKAFYNLDRLDEAVAFFQRAALTHKEIDSLWLAANDLYDLSTVLARMGNHEQAQLHLREASEILARFTDSPASRLRARIATDIAG